MSLWAVVKGIFAGKGDKILATTLASIDELSTSAEERGVLRKSVIETWVQSQAQTIEAEYRYGGWLARSWRPILMLMWGGCVTWTFIAPLFDQQPPDVPERLWTLLEYGVLGYIGGRSLEKMAAMIVPGAKMLKTVKALNEGGS